MKECFYVLDFNNTLIIPRIKNMSGNLFFYVGQFAWFPLLLLLYMVNFDGGCGLCEGFESCFFRLSMRPSLTSGAKSISSASALCFS